MAIFPDVDKSYEADMYVCVLAERWSLHTTSLLARKCTAATRQKVDPRDSVYPHLQSATLNPVDAQFQTVDLVLKAELSYASGLTRSETWKLRQHAKVDGNCIIGPTSETFLISLR